jgi:acetyl esterase/lipase
MGQYQFTMQSNLSYGPLASEVLDLCTPVGAVGNRPGVVLIHGGGWHAGDKGGHDKDCQYLASHGFVAITINYRLVPAAIYPAQVVDAQLAVRWLRANAATYQLDPQRLCAWGDSAGGYLVVELGVLSNILAGDEAGLLANESPTVQCVVDEFGPSDFTNATNVRPQQMTTVINFLGTTPQQNPTLYHDASPVFGITAQTAPMLIVQGTQDSTVPQAQSLELQQHLQAAGVAVQYIAYPGNHEFVGLSADQKQTIEEQMLGYVVAQEHP